MVFTSKWEIGIKRGGYAVAVMERVFVKEIVDVMFLVQP
jgi:hypothetical protein